MKLLLALFLLLSVNYQAIAACDLSQPDKLKHIEVAKRATIVGKKVFLIPLLPLKPVKWVFNDKIQLVFPDNYLPQILAGSLVFTAGVLKEVPVDLIWPGRHVSYCDIVADCHGIKEGATH